MPDRFADAVTAVAADADVSADALRDAVARHQALAAGGPGVESVDDLVYEYRTGLPTDPLVARTPDAYYLAVSDRVWADFADRLALGADEAAALRAVHARVFDAEVDRAGGEGDANVRRRVGEDGGAHPMVLDRE